MEITHYSTDSKSIYYGPDCRPRTSQSYVRPRTQFTNPSQCSNDGNKKFLQLDPLESVSKSQIIKFSLKNACICGSMLEPMFRGYKCGRVPFVWLGDLPKGIFAESSIKVSLFLTLYLVLLSCVIHSQIHTIQWLNGGKFQRQSSYKTAQSGPRP